MNPRLTSLLFMMFPFVYGIDLDFFSQSEQTSNLWTSLIHSTLQNTVNSRIECYAICRAYGYQICGVAVYTNNLCHLGQLGGTFAFLSDPGVSAVLGISDEALSKHKN